MHVAARRQVGWSLCGCVYTKFIYTAVVLLSLDIRVLIDNTDWRTMPAGQNLH
eukprot:SAG31_NODE_26533_length_440_cov_1.401760_1_plen_52_part_01